MSEGLPTATIKFGKGYDDPWFVASGSIESLRSQIINAFDIYDNNQSLGSLIAEASQIAQGLWQVAKRGGVGLGGSVIATASETPSGASTGTSSAPAAKTGDAPSPYAGAIEEIKLASSKDELKSLYAKHAAAFKASPEVQAAFKARSAEVN